MKNQTVNLEEHALVAQRLNEICRALPWCQGLSWRFSDLQEDALSDLYAALEGLCTRFCEIIGARMTPHSDPSRCLGSSLARYLYDHPDRCEETLSAIGNSAASGWNAKAALN